jgi:hypothetical protein
VAELWQQFGDCCIYGSCGLVLLLVASCKLVVVILMAVVILLKGAHAGVRGSRQLKPFELCLANWYFMVQLRL